MTATATAPAVVVSPADVTSIPFEFEGLTLALRRAQSHDREGNIIEGKFFHGLYTSNPKTASYGVQLPALDEDLPTSVVLDGVEITLEKGETASEKKTKDKKTDVVTVTKVTPRPKTSFDGKVVLPTFGTSRQVKVIFSVRQDGTWNVIAMATDVPTPVSPEERAAKAATKAAGNLAAILAALGQA